MASNGSEQASSFPTPSLQQFNIADTAKTTPARKPFPTEIPSESPLSCLASPLSTSDFSLSPLSTTFLSLSGAAASTPLSSLDGGDEDNANNEYEVSDGDKHAMLGSQKNQDNNGVQHNFDVADDFRLGSEKGEAPPANTTTTMAQLQSSIRAVAERGDTTLSKNTESQISRWTSASTLTSTLISNPNPTSTSDISSESPALTAALIRKASTTSSRNLITSSVTTTLVQPRATRPPTSPLPPQQSAFVRTISHTSLNLNNNSQSAAFSGNVAQLEESAEQLSSSGSIEAAIREAHQELKRSDSRRSSILAASLRQSSVNDPSETLSTTDSVSIAGQSSIAPSRRDFSRQSSIIGLNSAARSGAFSPNDYIMSPNPSIVGGGDRQRPASKADSAGSGPNNAPNGNMLGITDQSITGDDAFPYLSRHGTGKSSMRSVLSSQSVQSGKLSMPEIAELEHPVTLTQDALDEADRLMATGGDQDDDDTIRASAHQHVEDDENNLNADNINLSQAFLHQSESQNSWSHPTSGSSVGTDSALLSSQSPPPIARPSVSDYLGYSVQQQYAPISTYSEYPPLAEAAAKEEPGLGPGPEQESGRLMTSGSGGTYEQAQTAFHDFDGVHCDPEDAAKHFSGHSPSILEAPREAPEDPTRNMSPSYKPRLPLPSHPTSYRDPSTGQQMLFYPARVPAMLQLPQKLSRSTKTAERNARRSQVMSMIMRTNEPAPEARQSRVWLPDPITEDMGSPFVVPLNLQSSDLPSASFSPNPQSQTGSGLGAADGDVNSQPNSKPNSAPSSKAGSVLSGFDGKRGDLTQLRRPSRLNDAADKDKDKRKSHMSTMSKLPPQLRASAFFDFPATLADIEVKNGSAMDTLDSVLDASASAPVSAFTDHAFAGHLGTEIYGAEKKRTKASAAAIRKSVPLQAHAPTSTQQPRPELRKTKSRSSLLSIVGHIRKVSDSANGMDDSRSDVSVARPRPRRRLSKSMSGAMLSPGSGEGNGAMAPDDDERPSDNEVEELGENGEHDDSEISEDDEDDADELGAYQGAPTTLLAELQLRKQQQKMRTRPINKAFPNGMHSTLLELDAVAEVERKSRNNKRVNLAWEDPAMNSLIGGVDDNSDDDVPLGLLFAAKAAGNNDISAVAADMNRRPLGLMEKKELEDNEPLSRRRDRLQGRTPAAASMYLGPSFGGNAAKRQSTLTLTPTVAAMSAVNAGSERGNDEKANSDAGVDEVDDEPLTVRRSRMKAKEESELPRPRPVSMAFSEELLGQFVDPEAEAKEREQQQSIANEKVAAASLTAAPEAEEETLGQRRRRLQAEKEARLLEMGGSGFPSVNGQALHALTGSRRLSMADMLAAHPLAPAQGLMHPRDAERLRREQDAARIALAQEQKMAMMRAQMPRNMSNTSLGGGVTKAGGFLGGRFNDGSGGIMASSAQRNTMMLPQQPQQHQYQQQYQQQFQQQYPQSQYGGAMGSMAGMNMNMNRSTMYGSVPQQNMVGGYGGGTVYSGMGNGLGMPMQLPMQVPMGAMQMPMGMQMQPAPQVQVDRVERWRQDVQP